MKKLFSLLAVLCCLFAGCERRPDKPAKPVKPIPLKATVSLCSDCYPNHELENSLDGDPEDDYTAFQKLDRPTVFELTLSRPVVDLQIAAVFESARNYAKNWQIEALDENRRPLFISQVAGNGKKQQTRIYSSKPFSSLRFTFRDFAGQGRLLLRQLTFKEFRPDDKSYPFAGEDFAVKILYNGSCYDQYGVDNSLDGDWQDDYTAFTEDAVPAHIDLELTKPQKRLNLEIMFESKTN